MKPFTTPLPMLTSRHDPGSRLRAGGVGLLSMLARAANSDPTNRRFGTGGI